ncbi:hypothetical protein BH23BAC1_BH23BAC1_25310 [soil metagenome]
MLFIPSVPINFFILNPSQISTDKKTHSFFKYKHHHYYHLGKREDDVDLEAPFLLPYMNEGDLSDWLVFEGWGNK